MKTKLRKLDLKDAPLMLEWMHDHSVVKDLHRNFAEMTIEDCERFIDRSLSTEGSDIHLAIADDNDEYLGTVSLKSIDNKAHTAEFGITVRTCAMGSGIAKAAMDAMLEKAYTEYEVIRVYWCVSPDNTRALRFYDKQGYTRVNIRDTGDIYDTLTMAVNAPKTYSQDEIDRYVWYLYEKPVDVSVYMMTYFHEKYVRQAIESVLSQKTYYRYELVISDDHSEDATPDILREYASRYPDIIRVNINERNLGIPANIYKARTMCRGRYITNLSGDDYWIDENKIETETRFMDEHPEYSAVACCIELRMGGSETPYATVPSDSRMINRAYSIKDYEKCIPLGTHGLFMRNFFATEDGRQYFAQARQISEFVDDAVDEVLLLRKGSIYILDIKSDAHRVVPPSADHNNYNSRYSRLEKFQHHIDLLNAMNTKWGDEIDFSGWYANYSATGILSMLVSRNFVGYRRIFATIPARMRHPLYRSVYIRWIPFAFKMVFDRFSRRSGI